MSALGELDGASLNPRNHLQRVAQKNRVWTQKLDEILGGRRLVRAGAEPGVCSQGNRRDGGLPERLGICSSLQVVLQGISQLGSLSLAWVICFEDTEAVSSHVNKNSI